MKLYYHKTDGGAEYYCLEAVEGTDGGKLSTAVLRTDGDEIELLTKNLLAYHIKVVEMD